jgi:hypothetical protein
MIKKAAIEVKSKQLPLLQLKRLSQCNKQEYRAMLELAAGPDDCEMCGS